MSVSSITNENKERVAKPVTEHFVQFYVSDASLMQPLSAYIQAGLDAGENCMAIVTDAHQKALDSHLTARGVDVAAAKQSGRFVALDAVETLALFMVDGLPDWERFTATVGAAVHKVHRPDGKIRLYGEMVGVLWKSGNRAAVLQLEEFWNRLIENRAASLYCAYPALHFINYAKTQNAIRACHTNDMASAAGR